MSIKGAFLHQSLFGFAQDTQHKVINIFLPDGNLYCKMCYTRNFGPQTRSASDIDHKIIDTSIIKAEDPKRNCPRYDGNASSFEFSSLSKH